MFKTWLKNVKKQLTKSLLETFWISWRLLKLLWILLWLGLWNLFDLFNYLRVIFNILTQN